MKTAKSMTKFPEVMGGNEGNKIGNTKKSNALF